MREYIIQRLFSLLPTLLIVAIISFGIVHFIPGDPATNILGNDATIEDIEALRSRLGLDKPLHSQFLSWAGGLIQGDLGTSLYTNRPVTSTIVTRIEPTFLLAGCALFIALLLGVPAGIVSALKRNSAVDQTLLVVTLLGVSMPNFWLGLNLILLLSVTNSVLPVAGYVQLNVDWVASLRHLVLPAVALGFSQAAIVSRITRTSMLEVLGQDYIRTAHAKGLRSRVVLWKHGLRNAMVSILTIVGVVTTVLLSGSVVVETVFSLPGLGRAMIDSVQRRDYPVIQGIIIFIAATNVLINLLVDLSYVALDPRIQYN